MDQPDEEIDWATSRGEGKKKPRRHKEPIPPTQVTVSSEFELLLETEIYGGGCCSSVYSGWELEFLERIAKKYIYSQDIRRMILGTLLWKLHKSSAKAEELAVTKELVAAKIGEYGITLSNFNDLMRVYKHLKCGCGITIDDVAPATKAMLRAMIDRSDPYTNLAAECSVIPTFDIGKLQDAIVFQKEGIGSFKHTRLYDCRRDVCSNSISATCYWKKNDEEIITNVVSTFSDVRLSADYYINGQRNEEYDFKEYDRIGEEDLTDDELIYLFTLKIASPTDTREIYVPISLYTVFWSTVDYKLKLKWKVVTGITYSSS